jgi:hypothetical protein
MPEKIMEKKHVKELMGWRADPDARRVGKISHRISKAAK